MVSDACQLALRVDRTPFDLRVDLKQRQREQLVEKLALCGGATSRVAGLEQERQADRDLALLADDRLAAPLRDSDGVDGNAAVCCNLVLWE